MQNLGLADMTYSVDRHEIREARIRSHPGEQLRQNHDRAHPIYAPLAWIVCLLLGAAFWIAVIQSVS